MNDLLCHKFPLVLAPRLPFPPFNFKMLLSSKSWATAFFLSRRIYVSAAPSRVSGNANPDNLKRDANHPYFALNRSEPASVSF